MAIGERIHYFRILRGMTQKYLGMVIGFPEKSADIRMAQYESGTRSPKEEITEKLAQALDVSPKALDVPDIDSYVGLMHTLFALEDIYGLKISRANGKLCLQLDPGSGEHYFQMLSMLEAWQEQKDKLEAGEITEDDYDRWRYRYPEFDTTKIWAKVPSDQLSRALAKGFRKK